MTLPIINIIGPTACGKTDIAISAAKILPITIISVDSALIYRGMDIGTAKPDKKLQADIPHHLIDICDPHDTYSAGNFVLDAYRLIHKSHAEQRIPMLVGGTMLYFKALYQGIAKLPPAAPMIRHYLEQLATRKNWQHCHALLQQVDPVSAKQIHPNDPQRIQRALEVFYISGQPLSQFWEHTESMISPTIPQLTIALYPQDREQLHQKITKRFDLMLKNGFLDEVAQLVQQPKLEPELPAMRAVGYRQAWQYIVGKIDYQTMRENAIVATRQLAKRQMTWLKTWPKIDYWFDPFSDQDIQTQILKLLEDFYRI